MKSITNTVLLLLILWPLAEVRSQNTAPFTKQEILSRLKEIEARHLSQADIATEINQRGIAFPIDEKTLAELRQAGARSFLLDAIQRAGKNQGRPQVADPPVVNDEPRITPPDAPPPKLSILEQARQHALEFAEELPNFIVTQVVTRSLRSPETRDWQNDDKLEIELTYRAGKGEEFKLLRIDGKPAKQSYEDLGGSTSTGEFGSILAALFSLYSRADFKEVKHETFHGRPSIVYDFRVKRANSTSTISDKDTRKTVIAGYSGSVWIDTESGRVVRVEESHDDIPAGFPVSLSENAVEYDWVTIAGERYLLPIRAEVLLGRDDKRIYTRNVIEFSGYHKFEAKIKMDPN